MIVHSKNGNTFDLTRGVDCSIPLSDNEKNPLAWDVDPPKFEPVKTDQWTGLVKAGSAINFRTIFFNPHGHGTHTECLGHITPEIYSINQHLTTFFFEMQLISITPERKGDDYIITEELLEEKLRHISSIEALMIRTLPNSVAKKQKKYSGTNPTYLTKACLGIIDQLHIKHLLIDLPSVDKEDDGGKTVFHHGFWGVPDQPKKERTITELIYVPNHIKDGHYLLNLQVAPFENDAAPSRPIIFPIITP